MILHIGGLCCGEILQMLMVHPLSHHLVKFFQIVDIQCPDPLGVSLSHTLEKITSTRLENMNSNAGCLSDETPPFFLFPFQARIEKNVWLSP